MQMRTRLADARGAAHEAAIANPFLSVIVKLVDMVALVGSVLALVFAVGYGLAGRGVATWGPDVAILVGLLLLDVGVRWWRRRRRLASWRRWHPERS